MPNHKEQADRGDIRTVKKQELADALSVTTPPDNLDWRTCGIVELAIRNPNVASYIEHWEGRALRAEAQLQEKP